MSLPSTVEHPSVPSFLHGNGDMGARMRAHNWPATALGDPRDWSPALTTLVRVMLAAPQAMFLAVGPERILLYNDAYAPVLGTFHPRALGRPFFETWPDLVEKVAPLMDQVFNGEPFEVARYGVTLQRNGFDEETWFTFCYTPVGRDDGSVEALFCTCTEITSQIVAENRLRASEDRLVQLNSDLEMEAGRRTQERDRIWERSRDMLGVADDKGIWLSVNPAWTKILGWRAEEIVGRTSQWMEHPEDVAKTRSEVGSLAAGNATLDFENRFRTKDGDYRTLAWSAVPEEGQFYCIARDVTEERRRAASLRLFMDIVESASAPICAFDTNYRLIAFNKAHAEEFFRIYGTRVHVGDVFPDRFPSDQGTIMRGFMTRALAGEVFTVTEEFGDPDLAKPYWELAYSPIRDDVGQVVAAFHYAQDISDRLRAQAELEAIQDALRQSQKMEAVGQLTGGLAHDFNNLLAGISGSLELTQNRMGQGRLKDVERYLLAAQSGVKRAASLTHRLLAFSRRQTLDPRPTDVNRLVADMQELVQRTVGPGIPVEIVGASELWPTLVDPSQLENALLNLCINARDAMPDGGRITIETANRWFDARTARQHDMPEGQYLLVCVTDTGTGMSPELIEKVFEPFFTTKPIGEGTGLGLSMVYGFARQSGGQVRINSEVGIGTTVCVYLPRHHGEVEDATIPKAYGGQPRSVQELTVLVVDDEPLVRMLVTDTLEDLGYTAIEASDSASGLRILQSDAQIDLLVSDVGLPGGMNGRQMVDAARLVRPDLKVLFVTGYAENSILNHGHLTPGTAVITKPFDMDVLATRIRAMVEG